MNGDNTKTEFKADFRKNTFIHRNEIRISYKNEKLKPQMSKITHRTIGPRFVIVHQLLPSVFENDALV